jgi:hypothetical protein
MTVDTVDREAIYAELRRARVTFRRLVQDASPGDLARASDGTRWTNQQLLFHMLLGYLIMRALIVLAGTFAWLPARASRVFARLLDAATTPFNGVNYAGSCAGAKVFPQRRMAAKLDQITIALGAAATREDHRPAARRDALPDAVGPLLQGLHDPG